MSGSTRIERDQRAPSGRHTMLVSAADTHVDDLTRPARTYPYWMIDDHGDRKRRQALAPIDRNRGLG